MNSSHFESFSHGKTKLTTKEIGEEQVKVHIKIENYQELQCPMNTTYRFHLDITVEDILKRLALKTGSDVSLFLERFSLFPDSKKSKPLEKEKTLKQLNYKAQEATFILRTIQSETIIVKVLIEQHKELHTAREVTEMFRTSDKVSSIIHRIAQKSSVDILDKEEHCALFLPTNKAKKGIFLEQNKFLRDYVDFNSKVQIGIVLRYRKKEELILEIQIEDYEEIHCAKSITSTFNVNVTIHEIINKICHKRSVYIEQPSKYLLFYPAKKTELNPSKTLKDYELTNREVLILKKKRNFFGSREKNALILAENSLQSEKEVFRFVSSEREKLFWGLTLEGLKKASEGEQRYKAFSSLRRSERSIDDNLFIFPENTSFAYSNTSVESLKEETPSPEATPALEKNNSQEIEEKPQPKPAVKKRLGALKKKKEPSNAMFLIQIFQNAENYLTLGVNSECTVEDMIEVLVCETACTNCSLYIGQKGENGQLVEVRNLQNNEILIDIKKNWEETKSTYIFCLRDESVKGRQRTAAIFDMESPFVENPSDGSGKKKYVRRIPSSVNTSAEVIDLITSEKAEILYGSLRTKIRSNTLEKKSSLSNSAVLVSGKGNEVWIDSQKLKKEKKLSQGAYAKVYYGTYDGKEVAIKTLLGEVTASHITSFISEFQVLCNVKSSRLVSFYGASVQDSTKLSLVMEYCPNGSLNDTLQLEDDMFCFTWEKILFWFYQTVQGINVLHTWDPQLVHRDIKSPNLLCDAEYNIKVCDFGLSRFRTLTNANTLGELRGTMAYCPPEIYDGGLYSYKSDVYSIGMVLWEMAMRILGGKYSRPFEEYQEITFEFQIIIQTSKNKLRPSIPDKCPPFIRQLIERCWHQEPNQRPSCKEILEILDPYISKKTVKLETLLNSTPFTSNF